jgi:exodeoxyribonuclease-5
MVMLLTHFGAYPAKVKSGLHKAHNKNSSGIYRRYFNVSYSSFSINSLIQKLDIKKSIKTWKLSQDQRRLPKICLEAWIKILSSFQSIKNKVFAKLPDGTLFACQKSDLKKGLATSRGNLRKDRQYLTRRALLGVNWYLAAKINPEATKLILYCLKEDTWFSTVTKIKRIKKASRVYDVCVPEGNYFIADGLINHNTFLMQLMSELKLRMYFSAPTNKAAKVLGVSVKSVAKTIYSLLGLRMEQVEDKLVLSEGRDHPYFPAGAIIVIDEASMLNEQLCTILKKVQLKHRIKILVVGDPIQIPPVGEAKTLAWKFTQDQECRAVLKEQMRFDNQILALSTRLRECIKNKDWTSPIRSDHSESEGVWKYRTEEQFERSILKVINTSEDCLQNKVMAWRNKTVNYYNKLIRRHLGFKGDYCVGDIILLAEPIEDDDGNLIAHTDDEFTITGIDHSEITVDQENVPVWVLQVQGDKSYILNVPEDPDTLARILSQKAMFAKKQKDQFRAAAWKNFWKTKKTFNAVRYGYALTAHRGQGSTYTNVWVDQLDILSNPNKREAFSCLYVACTRPTTILSSF